MSVLQLKPVPHRSTWLQSAACRALRRLAKTALLPPVRAYRRDPRLLPSRQVAILRYHAICGAEGYAYADPVHLHFAGGVRRHCRYLSPATTRCCGSKRSRRACEPDEAAAAQRRVDHVRRRLCRQSRRGPYPQPLRRRRRRSTSPPDCLAGGAPFWPSEIRHLVPAVPAPALQPRRRAHRHRDLRFATTPSARRRFAPSPNCSSRNAIPVREALRAQLREAAGRSAAPACMLTWERVVRDASPRHDDRRAHADASEPAERRARGRDARDHRRRRPGSKRDRRAVDDVLVSQRRRRALLHARSPARRAPTAATWPRRRRATRSPAPTSDLYALERIEVEERLEDLVFALEVERFAFKPARSQSHRAGA